MRCGCVKGGLAGRKQGTRGCTGTPADPIPHVQRSTCAPPQPLTATHIIARTAALSNQIPAPTIVRPASLVSVSVCTLVQHTKAHFDSETKEEKEAAYLEFLVAQKIRDKVEAGLRPIVKIVIVLACAAAIFGVIVLLSGIPRTIDKQFSAVQFRVNDEHVVENTTIAIKGKLYKRLFTEPRFEGAFVIDSYAYTKTYELADIVLDPSVKQSSGVLTYASFQNGMAKLQGLGMIFVGGNFDELMIKVFEPEDGDRKSTTDLILAAPAATRAEAMQIFMRLELGE